jgi:hypothetical protein
MTSGLNLTSNYDLVLNRTKARVCECISHKDLRRNGKFVSDLIVATEPMFRLISKFRQRSF